MPYPGIKDPATIAKMDRCVEDVQRKQHLPKSRAIAICRASIVKKEYPMSKKNKKSKLRNKYTPQAKPKEVALGEEFEEEPLDEPIIGEEIEDVQSEEEEKDYYAGPVEVTPAGVTVGATSFADLEAAREAREKVGKIVDLSYDLETIVRNILADEEIDDKPAAIKAAADEFGGRVSGVKAKSFLDELVGYLKAKLTRASINDLPDSDFAYIEPGGKKDEDGKTVPRSLRHYPVHDAAHARNALARAAQAIKRGGESAGIARKALPKIRAACKKFGIEISEKEYAGLLNAPGEALFITKDAKDNWRWVGIWSNNFKDRDGDLLTGAAHKEFIEYLDAHPEKAPFFAPWHTLQAKRKARADFWDYTNNFMVLSGILTDEEAAALVRAKEKYILGMSHGFFALSHEANDRHAITKYRSFEVGELPIEFASNTYTALDVLMKEVTMAFKPEKRQYLIDLLGEETVVQIEASTKTASEALAALGVESKEADEKPEEVEVKLEVKAEDLAAQIIKVINLDGLNAMLEGIEARLKTMEETSATYKVTLEALKKSREEELAEMIAPPLAAGGFIWSKRASQDTKTVLNEEDEKDKKLIDAAPKVSWLAEAFSASP